MVPEWVFVVWIFVGRFVGCLVGGRIGKSVAGKVWTNT